MVMLGIIHIAVLCVAKIPLHEPLNETQKQSYWDKSISLSSVWQRIHIQKPNKETHEEVCYGKSI